MNEFSAPIQAVSWRCTGFSQDYETAVTHMIDRWAQNEERTAYQFLTSSAEFDERSPLIANRTRANIVQPVRRYLRKVDDGGKTEDESDSTQTPVHRPEKVSWVLFLWFLFLWSWRLFLFQLTVILLFFIVTSLSPLYRHKSPIIPTFLFLAKTFHIWLPSFRFVLQTTTLLTRTKKQRRRKPIDKMMIW